MFLDRIVTRTLEDLAQRKQDRPLEEIRHLAIQQSPPRDLLEAFAQRSRVNLIAEVKRASPSKGMLAPHLDPVETARIYEANGAAAISVLTEPHFFLGSPTYLTEIKNSVSVPVLRKDFIVDEYQVYEARAWGADAILLICAILDDTQLRHLLHVAHDLRMRCLVEVHNTDEARRAVDAGAVIIGVNSRDLVTFQMNPSLIRDLRPLIPANRVVIAESGIHTAADARRLARYDVQAMLVGESLVVSADIPAHMRALLSGANEGVQVKICGLRTPEQINAAIEAGADLLGLVFHEASHRALTPDEARGIVEASQLSQYARDGRPTPELVGLFVNKDAEYVNEVAQTVGLTMVQLHGTESPEFCRQMTRPVIKALHLHDQRDLEQIDRYRPVTWRLLLDTPSSTWGGTGQTHDWELARLAAQQAPIFLAGGLTPENVADAIRQVHPRGVDVSSGVETNKQKDIAKIRAFIAQARAVSFAHR